MKTLTGLPIAVLILSFAPAVRAQDDIQTINVNEVMKVTQLGDAEQTITFTLPAQSFAQWNSKYGQDQGLLKRDMNNNYVGQFDTSDWKVNIDGMNRTVTVSMKIRGAVIPRGGGTFEFQVPKQWRGGERNGTTYAYNFVESISGGTVGQTNVKVQLPATATKFTEDKSETGDPVIQYRVPVGGLAGYLLYAGIGLLVLGLVVLVIGLVTKPAAQAPPQMPMRA